MALTKIVGMLAASNGITLFTAAGAPIVLTSDSWRTQAIVDRILIPLGREGSAEIDLDEFSLEKRVLEATRGRVLVSIEPPAADKPDSKPEVKVLADNGALIEDGEKLLPHIERAAYGDATGFTRFMESYAEIPHKHSAQELLDFMQINDMPLADDGSIVCFKVLCATDEAGVFVDPHTKRVRQRVGSHVSMPVELVDDSRRRDCGTGLHVCTKGYVSGFWANDRVLTLIKVQARDVIAVPHSERTKMRACAYHVVKLLPADVADHVKAGRPLVDHSAGAAILADVIAGNHVGIIERVVIGGPNGTNLTITPVEGAGEPERKTARKANAKPQVDPRKLRDQLKEAGVALDAPDLGSLINQELAKPKSSKKAAAKPASAKIEEIGDDPYKQKLEQARAMRADGKSLRKIAEELGMCRKLLAKRI